MENQDELEKFIKENNRLDKLVEMVTLCWSVQVP